MKKLIYIFAVVAFYACQNTTTVDNNMQHSEIKNPISDSTDAINNEPIVDSTSTLPESGTYRYDIAFAEWQGESMGEKVKVIINNDSIKVIYEGDGKLNIAKGKILDEGILLQHKSGNWIIAHNLNDATIDEIGGCSGGPAIIDTKTKKYWTC